MTKILIADDHEVVRSGLRSILEAQPRWVVVGEARDGKEAISMAFETMPDIDFRAHAESMGAVAVKVSSIADLETAIEASKNNDRTSVIVIDTDPLITTKEGGHWWDVAVPEVSPRSEVNKAREAYVKALEAQRIG